MYQLILFDEQNVCTDVYRSITNVIVEGNNVAWLDSEIRGIQTPFIVIEGNIEIGIGDLIEDYVKLDIKDTLKGETALLRDELNTTQAMLNNLLMGGLK